LQVILQFIVDSLGERADSLWKVLNYRNTSVITHTICILSFVVELVRRASDEFSPWSYTFLNQNEIPGFWGRDFGVINLNTLFEFIQLERKPLKKNVQFIFWKSICISFALVKVHIDNVLKLKNIRNIRKNIRLFQFTIAAIGKAIERGSNGAQIYTFIRFIDFKCR